MNKRSRELLFRSFDDRLTEREQRELKEALAASPELQEEKEHLTALRGDITAGAADSFKPFFAERVMHRLESSGVAEPGPMLFFESLARLFRRVAVAGAVAVVALVVINLWDSGDVSLNAAVGAPETTLEELLESPYESALES